MLPVADRANQSAGMILGIHLGEPLRFGGTGFMTLRAKYGRVRFGRYEGNVLGVFRLWAVASLARDASMFFLGLLLEDIDVAGFTGLVPGVGDG